MTMIATSRVAALAAAILLCAPAAWAQPAQPAQPVVPSIEQRVEAYLTKLHDDLQITPAQEAQWRRYAAVIRENARDMGRVFEERTRQLRSMTAVANLKSYERLAEAHVARLKRLIPAFERLYASMTAKQKLNADQMFRERAEQRAAAHGSGSSQPSK